MKSVGTVESFRDPSVLVTVEETDPFRGVNLHCTKQNLC